MQTDQKSFSEAISVNISENFNAAFSGLAPNSEKQDPYSLSRWFFLVRIVLTTALLLFTAMLTVQKDIGHVSAEISTLFILLLFSYAFSLVIASGLKFGTAPVLLVKLQVVWDLAFTTMWIFWTGGTGSLFLFLYLFIIIEACILLDLFNSAMIAFLCGLSYWAELHLEFHQALFPKATLIAAPVITSPSEYPVSNLIFILAAMLSAAWLTISLKQRLSKTDSLLREKSDSIQDLLLINDSIVRCIRSGLITLDWEQRITSVNKAAVMITQHNEEDLLGNKVEDFLGSIPLEELTEQEVSSDIPLRWEQSFLRKDNIRMTLGCSGAVLQDSHENRLGHLIVFQDLSYYKQMEEELKRAEKLAAIGEMAAGLAHEIRNPLASLYGSIQLLQNELSLEGSQMRLMNIILKESERLNGLITDFLQFASPNAGLKESFCFLVLATETLEVFKQGPHKHSGIEIITNIDPTLQLYANLRQTQQMLWNLLLNAVQAISEKGIIRIKAEETKSTDGYHFVTLIIEDTGKGIPLENQNKIFDPFYTNRQEGTGLGLSIVYRIVENHEGRIHVKSKVGEGTKFKIDMPLSCSSTFNDLDKEPLVCSSTIS